LRPPHPNPSRSRRHSPIGAVVFLAIAASDSTVNIELAKSLNPGVLYSRLEDSMLEKPAFRTIVAATVLLTSFVCPVVELFDRWDRTPQTGQDTEFIFMILALCIGAVYLLASLMARDRRLTAAITRVSDSSVQRSSVRATSRAFGLSVLIPISPPAAALRI
jgi:hypothetical protein